MLKKSLSFVLAVWVLFLFFLPVTVYGAGSPVEVECYYFNACGACDAEGDLRGLFEEATGGVWDSAEVAFVFHNTFLATEEAKFKQTCDRLEIPLEQRVLPMLLIGDTILSGQAQIKSDLANILNQETNQKAGASPDSNTSAPVYFFVSPCEECEEAKEFFGTLQPSYEVDYRGKHIQSTLAVEAHDISEAKGLDLARQYFAAWEVPESRQKVPVVFLRDGYLSGVDEIKSGLTQAILEGRCIGIETPGTAPGIKAFEWPAILLAGLINGLNPCSISMLLFMAALLLARNVNVLKLGVAFIAGKSLAYLLLGTALFGVMSSIGGDTFTLFQTAGKILLLVLSLAVAVVNLSDFIAAKNEKYNKIKMQLPAPLRRLNHQWIRRLTGVNGGMLILAVFALGLLVSVGEFLCTGQIYLATILYMIRCSTTLDLKTLGAFLIYIAGMMIPLLILTFAIWKGRSVFDVSELARKNMPAVKLITAVVFLAFGVLVFLKF